MRVAIVGTGIAGNVAAYELRSEHEITVFEAASYIGGHTNTVDVDDGGRGHGCFQVGAVESAACSILKSISRISAAGSRLTALP